MSIETVGICTFLLIFCSFFRSLKTTVILMGCLTMLTASSAMFIGSYPISPALVFLPVFVARSFMAFLASPQRRSLPISPSLIFLLIFLLYSFCITIYCPRLFEGAIMVDWGDREGNFIPDGTLKPGGSGNLTQSLYALAGGICFFFSFLAFTAIKKIDAIIDLVIAIACVNLCFTIADLGSYYSGNTNIMAIFRNTTYSLLDSDTINGIKRTVGSFTEASIYSIYNLGVFAFLLTLFWYRVRTRLTGLLALSTLVFLILALSTTAYVGLALYTLRMVVSGIYNFSATGRISKQALVCFLALFLVTGAGTIYYITNKGIPVLDILIFNKGDSDSGYDRSWMNHLAWNAFLDSYGLGIGLGSTRCSSFVLVLLSNVGIVGALLYGAFLYFSFAIPKHNNIPRAGLVSMIACREAIIASLLGAALSQVVFDLGLLIYLITGASSAVRFKLTAQRLKVSFKRRTSQIASA